MRCPSEAWGPYFDAQEQPCEVCGLFPDDKVEPCRCKACDTHDEAGCLPCAGPFVTFTRRTDDPKLSHLEAMLRTRGIPSRRNGYSSHAPILEVPESFHDAAYAILGEDVFGDGERYDDIEDDDPVFLEDYKRKDDNR